MHELHDVDRFLVQDSMTDLGSDFTFLQSVALSALLKSSIPPLIKVQRLRCIVITFQNPRIMDASPLARFKTLPDQLCTLTHAQTINRNTQVKHEQRK